ncbi:hypothetical protein GW17_00036159 [Ensete ventricosum]|nr:hypothetical protein GW17_00036159 [Ensete ventricosum]
MSTGGGGEKVGSGGSASAKTPSDFLKSIRGRPVVVKLNSGVDYRGPSSLILYSRLRFLIFSACVSGFHLYRIHLPGFVGILACLDGYMNIAMEQTEEYVNGQLKNKYGDAFIRGNNGKRQ